MPVSCSHLCDSGQQAGIEGIAREEDERVVICVFFDPCGQPGSATNWLAVARVKLINVVKVQDAERITGWHFLGSLGSLAPALLEMVPIGATKVLA